MIMLNAHFENRQVVLDDPLPANLPANVRVRVIIPAERRSKTLQALADLARSVPSLPRDLAANHDKYLYGPEAQ